MTKPAQPAPNCSTDLRVVLDDKNAHVIVPALKFRFWFFGYQDNHSGAAWTTDTLTALPLPYTKADIDAFSL